MFTNQKVLGLILLLFILGAGVYFTYSKFKKEVSSVTASPSPSPANLEFILNQTPSPVQQTRQQSQIEQQPPQQPKPSELPYFRNKYVGKHQGILTEESLKNKKAVVSTNKGTLEIEIFTDVPIASSNFLILADRGFYDGLKFHRVEKDFVVQGGDPLGDGTGGPGYTFTDEAVTRDYKKGIVAYANAGPNTNGSQFFIMLSDKLDLPKRYTIFGNVISGMDVVENIKVGDIIQKAVIQSLQ
ncbi:MAG: peptidylprolyl isomerase [Patescibacteria group bacterium]